MNRREFDGLPSVFRNGISDLIKIHSDYIFLLTYNFGDGDFAFKKYIGIKRKYGLRGPYRFDNIESLGNLVTTQSRGLRRLLDRATVRNSKPEPKPKSKTEARVKIKVKANGRPFWEQSPKKEVESKVDLQKEDSPRPARTTPRIELENLQGLWNGSVQFRAGIQRFSIRIVKDNNKYYFAFYSGNISRSAPTALIPTSFENGVLILDAKFFSPSSTGGVRLEISEISQLRISGKIFSENGVDKQSAIVNLVRAQLL